MQLVKGARADVTCNLFGHAPALRLIAILLSSWCALTGCDFLTFSEPVLDTSPSAGAGGADEVVGAGGAGETPVVTCDPANRPCGPSKSGASQVCFRASALAGQDFCAEACDPSQPTGEDQLCVESGALLQRCHPDGADDAADCPAGLNCYRTNLNPLANAGLCIKMPVCARDSDCLSPSYDSCAASLVGSFAGAVGGFLHLDHLNCVHRFCVSLDSACSPTEGCLGTQYSTDVADICTPNCDDDAHCPPNYSCARATSGQGAANLCVPGVPGVRCSGPNCVLGACEDTGAGFSICTTGCAEDADCAVLNTPTDTFMCVEGGGVRHCVTPRPFDGANCTLDSQCRPERNELCSRWDPTGKHEGRGECRVPCNEDGTCDPQGGLPHVCLWAGLGGCFPGRLGLPCQKSSECFSNLCADVPADSDLGLKAARLCTLRCGLDGESEEQADQECDSLSNLSRAGYCNGGYCRGQQLIDEPCTRDAQCVSKLCDTKHQKCLFNAAVGVK